MRVGRGAGKKEKKEIKRERGKGRQSYYTKVKDSHIKNTTQVFH